MQNFIQQHGYLALFLLAIVESMCVPIPSEVTFAFGGAMCTTAIAGDHPLNIVVVIAIGAIGSLIGSVIAYEVGRYAGRPIVDRYGKWVLLTHKDLDTAERWFAKWGDLSVFLGRVIPVVRTVISVPAGLAKMKRGRFAVLTTLGATIWVGVLTAIGYALGTNWEHVAGAFKVAQYPIVAIIAILVVLGFSHRIRVVRTEHRTRGAVDESKNN